MSCVCVCDWDSVVCVLQVQNISQSMEVLDLRTYRDLQYVRNTEGLMKVVDGKLKVASDNPRGLNPKGFQVIVSLVASGSPRVCALLSSECRRPLNVAPHSEPCQMHRNLFHSS